MSHSKLCTYFYIMLDLKYSEIHINWNPCLQPEIIKLESVIRSLKKDKKRRKKKKTTVSIKTHPEQKGNLPKKRKAHWCRMCPKAWEEALIPQVVGAWWWLAGESSGVVRALAAPAAGRGYSKSLLHIPVMGPGHPTSQKRKLGLNPNYDEQKTLNIIQAQK